MRELLVANPDYPAPVVTAGLTPPATNYQLSTAIELPVTGVASVALQQSLAAGITFRVSYERGRGIHELRGRNLNAPSVAGLRPDPTRGNIVQIESLSRSQTSTFRLALSGGIPSIGLTLVGNYAFRRRLNESDGALDLPADAARPQAEWGFSSDDIRHQATLFAVYNWRSRVFVATTLSATSGAPYTVTTGGDENGDGVLNDRPTGVGRNTRRQPGQWFVQTRFSWSPRAGAGDAQTAVAAGARRASVQVFLDIQNLFNTPGWTGYAGVTASPLFGRPTSAAPPRRIECGFSVRY
jgi:hypothetical protein